MAKIRFDFGALTLDAELLDTPTAKAILAALPSQASVLTCSVNTWGDEVYFNIPVRVAREKDARDVVTAGEIAYWPDGPANPARQPGEYFRESSQRRKKH